MYFHSYDNHGEAEKGSVPITVFYRMTELPDVEKIPFNKWGQPAYPPAWQEDCYLARDFKDPLTPAPLDWSCTDNGGEVEGVFLSGFTFNNNGRGVQTLQ